MIAKTMLIEEIIRGFPQKGHKLRRAMRSFLACTEDLPNIPLEDFLIKKGKTTADVDFLVQKLNAVLQENADPSIISITEHAALKLKEFLSSEGMEAWGVKVADRPASCGTGYEYVFEPTPCPTSDDQVFLSNGIEIYAPRDHLKRFLGSLIDFEEGPIDGDHFSGLLGAGFTISNPNVKTTCACGCSNMYKEL
jgi:iron-sulfur cluster assembly accessory protein